ncbi:hypothetical protein ACEPAI_6092 [Sanghuangporus weigelae]
MNLPLRSLGSLQRSSGRTPLHYSKTKRNSSTRPSRTLHTPNGGIAVTDELKYNIKFGRQNGIHVSPTVLWDGLVANEISSSWTEQDWNDFFKAKVIV